VLVQLIFERFNCHSYYVAESPILSLYAANRTTGVVVDAGHGRLGEREPPPPPHRPEPCTRRRSRPRPSLHYPSRTLLRAKVTCTPRIPTSLA